MTTACATVLVTPSAAWASSSQTNTRDGIDISVDVWGAGLRIDHIRVRADRVLDSSNWVTGREADPFEYKFHYWTAQTNTWSPQKTAPAISMYNLCTGFPCSTSPSTGEIFFNRTLSYNQYFCAAFRAYNNGQWRDYGASSPVCIWVHS
ncbi:hypothetical protein [Rhizocola hellebori]|nr:hypothetical protein [Rhizocola hellebori]